jgi:glucan phosphoethanolaminetransferase (alkaline phosphatase superfamily)
MPTEDITPEDARRALSEISAREQGSAARLDWPLWRELVLSGCASGLLLTVALPTPFALLLTVFLVFGIIMMLRSYTTQPVWVSGYRKGRTLPLTIGFLAIYVLVVVGNWVGHDQTGSVWLPVASAITAFIILTVFNRVWMAVWRAEVREGRA